MIIKLVRIHFSGHHQPRQSTRVAFAGDASGLVGVGIRNSGRPLDAGGLVRQRRLAALVQPDAELDQVDRCHVNHRVHHRIG